MGIWNSLFGGNDDAEDEDQNERSWQVTNCKEGVDPRSAPSIGYGDCNRDYSDEGHHQSWGDAWKHRVDTNQPEDIDLGRRNK